MDDVGGKDVGRLQCEGARVQSASVVVVARRCMSSHKSLREDGAVGTTEQDTRGGVSEHSVERPVKRRRKEHHLGSEESEKVVDSAGVAKSVTDMGQCLTKEHAEQSGVGGINSSGAAAPHAIAAPAPASHSPAKPPPQLSVSTSATCKHGKADAPKRSTASSSGKKSEDDTATAMMAKKKAEKAAAQAQVRKIVDGLPRPKTVGPKFQRIIAALEKRKTELGGQPNFAEESHPSKLDIALASCLVHMNHSDRLI